METDLIARIRGRCARLVEIAPWWADAWAPLEPAEVDAFERRHGIALPVGFRRLLTEIGDRAPVPGRPRGALVPLARARADTVAQEWLGPLDGPFAGAGDEPIDLEWDDATDAYTDPAPLTGCLPVLDAGDSAYLLVVTGVDRGRVWSFAPVASPPLRPTGAEFLSWYLGELDRGLTPIEAEAERDAEYERRLAVEPRDLDACIELGRRLLTRDRERARALLERAWTLRDALGPDDRRSLERAIAELDLLDGRRDRLEAFVRMKIDDPWLRAYAGIAAARAGEHERAIARILPDEVPVLLRAAAIGWLAAAHAACGRPERALELLRATQASASNHALAARVRASLGQHDAARRSWLEALASFDRPPRPPSLAELVAPPVPERATIEAELARCQSG